MKSDGPFDPELHNRGRGAAAEEVAAEWLEARGRRVVGRNVTTLAGEIDLIVEHGETLCFVEVKARSSSRYGPAVAAVGPRKQARLARAAACYLAERPWEGPCRFDVVGLDRDDQGEWRVTLVEDAFQVGG